ncbi:MAG TPA: L-2-hydroxyglutarate oxidase [Kineosporiaceae bacterium]|nr:L-2-hydroxyglutarate oxidase [Kineosporiaceae bacterium]
MDHEDDHSGSGDQDVVVGAGIVGLAVARELTRRTGRPVTVVEKESRVAGHQTGRNSGVVHAGLYYPPGSLKATLCARGRDLLRDFAAGHGIGYRELGKVVVAVDAGELDGLASVEQRARANQVPGLRRLDAAGLAELEPQVRGVAALHSPHTAITDFVAVCRALAGEVSAAGGRVLLGREVTGLREAPSGVRVRLTDGAELRARRVVVCAGLHADQLARMAGGPPVPRIVPFRGEYLALRPDRRDLVRGLVYPVPDPRYPFLGVHATPRLDGEVLLGPNAVLALAREGYRRRDVDLRELAGYLTAPWMRGLARQHWRAGAYELSGSLLRPLYVRRARRLLPALRLRDVRPAPAGVRAQAVDGAGRLLDDFALDSSGAVTMVRNAPSPAATSSLAVAEHLVDGMGVRARPGMAG